MAEADRETGTSHPPLAARLALTRERASARHGAAALAALAGVLAFVIAHEVFPYHSYNHDEAVYLQQAAMLLEGQLTIEPPVVEPFRPWFFVADGEALYPKYAPVPAAMFAVGGLLGGYRIALGLIAAAVVALTYATVAEAFDRRTGLLAAALLVGTPLFVVQASVFLAYVPTLAWLLAFAWAALRADRTGDARWAALAGLCVGVAFFARPYTAVLFAVPFVALACWTMYARGWTAVRLQGTIAAVGLLGVLAALAYNGVLTGDPLRFPYEAFSPMDGPGFGWRSLWGHGLEYTPALALESNGIALAAYVTEWSVAPPLGVLAALVGLWLVVRRGRDADARRLVLAGLVVSVTIGQLYFWGTLNAIGNLDEPGFGLLGHLGPHYHLVLVVPTVAFGAHAIVVGWNRTGGLLAGLDRRRVRVGVVGVILVLGLLAGATTTASVASVIADNRQVTAAYETAYDPIEEAGFEGHGGGDRATADRALVFLPTPHGPWLAHPFQYLHNGPTVEGRAIYAQDRQVFDVLATFPDRRPYRYSYRGEWLPVGGQTVEPRLQRLTHARGSTVELGVTAGLPASAAGTLVRVETAVGAETTTVDPTAGTSVDLSVTVGEDMAVVAGPDVTDAVSIPVAERDQLSLTIYVDAGGLDSFEYDLTLPLQREDGRVAALTPRQRVCTDARLCGEAGGAYVPGVHRPGISLETSLSATDRAAAEAD